MSYYAGLTPVGGLTFPADVAVIPYEAEPGDTSRTRELIWDDDQWLASGWLPARTPTQLLTVRSRPSKLGLTIAPSEGDPGVLRVQNRLGTRIERLIVRAKDGGLFQATGAAPGARLRAKPVKPADAKRELARIFDRRAPQYPAGMDPQSRPGYSAWSAVRRPWQWMANQAGMPAASQRTSLMESSLASLRIARLEPGSYAAIVERSPEVVPGAPRAREEAALT